MKQKTFFMVFKELAVAINYLRPEGARLRKNEKFLICTNVKIIQKQ